MSTLLVDELFDGVEFIQPINITRSTQVAHIRAWIYKTGTLATGDLRLRVYDGATLLKTVTIPYTQINIEITNTYAHGYIRFDVEPLALNVGDLESYHEYTLIFDMINYVDDPNNYIGIIREWDKEKYIISGGSPVNDSENPAGIEIYSYRG